MAYWACWATGDNGASTREVEPEWTTVAPQIRVWHGGLVRSSLFPAFHFAGELMLASTALPFHSSAFRKPTSGDPQILSHLLYADHFRRTVI
jgi:hypothetical protein